MSRYYFRVFADYFKFELQNEGAEPLVDLWNEKTLAERFAVGDGVVWISAARNMDVPVLVEIQNVVGDEPFTEDTLRTWDHVVECSIDISSGCLVIWGTGEYYPDAPRVKLTPGTYQVRAYFGGLSTLSENGLTGDDVYVITLRSGSPIQPRVIKQYTGRERIEISSDGG